MRWDDITFQSYPKILFQLLPRIFYLDREDIHLQCIIFILWRFFPCVGTTSLYRVIPKFCSDFFPAFSILIGKISMFNVLSLYCGVFFHALGRHHFTEFSQNFVPTSSQHFISWWGGHPCSMFLLWRFYYMRWDDITFQSYPKILFRLLPSIFYLDREDIHVQCLYCGGFFHRWDDITLQIYPKIWFRLLPSIFYLDREDIHVQCLYCGGFFHRWDDITEINKL